MSHYSELKTKIKSKKDLVKALQKINGGKWKNCVEVHDEPQNLYGYKGDLRPQKAHIIIRRNNVSSASNDIGFVRSKDGTYQAIISEYDTSIGYNEGFLNKLNQLYSAEVIKTTASENGYEIEFSEVNGEIHITCKKN